MFSPRSHAASLQTLPPHWDSPASEIQDLSFLIEADSDINFPAWCYVVPGCRSFAQVKPQSSEHMESLILPC